MGGKFLNLKQEYCVMSDYSMLFLRPKPYSPLPPTCKRYSLLATRIANLHVENILPLLALVKCIMSV